MPLVIQLPRQIKTQDIEAYLGSAKQKKAERDLVGRGRREGRGRGEEGREGVGERERGMV